MLNRGGRCYLIIGFYGVKGHTRCSTQTSYEAKRLNLQVRLCFNVVKRVVPEEASPALGAAEAHTTFLLTALVLVVLSTCTWAACEHQRFRDS